MARKYELTKSQWQAIKSLVHPTRKGPGRPPRNRRQVLNGILWVIQTGAPWRDMPRRYGPISTVHDIYQNWRGDGTWSKIMTALNTDAGHNANALLGSAKKRA
ncbi:MAG: transposase [Planctomycetota bacterium]|nr:transposase [Planctomycetota bacterium]